MNEINHVLVEEMIKIKDVLWKKSIDENTHLVTDLHFNSIDLMQLIVAIENRFHIIFDIEEYMESGDIFIFKSFKDYVCKKVSEMEERNATRTEIG